MDDLFLILGAIFAIAMMVLMVKYAKFIHSQPKIDAERRKMNEDGSAIEEENSNNNQ
ncbi:MAG: hypothetical protein H8E32_07365 [Nitrospinae bacterium]|nr:hypothetical protein [Nitrospinota bacterium]